MKVPCYVNPTGSNYYAKPIEGLFAVVDLLRSEATGVVDEGVVPVPEDDWGYNAGRGRRPPALAAGVQPGPSDPGRRSRIRRHGLAHRVGHLALSPARRQAPGHRALEHRRARRRALASGALPGASLRGVRALHGPGPGLVFPHLHGQRRVRLRPVPDPADGRCRLPRPRHVPAGARQRRPGQAAGESRTRSACSSAPSAIRPGAISRCSRRANPPSCPPRAGPIPSWWCAAPQSSATTTT